MGEVDVASSISVAIQRSAETRLWVELVGQLFELIHPVESGGQ
jgi:hypothetical protein